MIELQAINKILQDKDFSFVINSALSKEYFTGYEAEFEFIRKHFEKYKNVPDKATFISAFPDFEFTDVKESTKYIVDKLRENHVYNAAVPIITKTVELFKEDSNRAVEYLRRNIDTIKTAYGVSGVDIIQDAMSRLQELEDKCNNRDNWFFKSGFPELDIVIGGIQRGEELIVVFARTNQGKSWIAEKMAVSVWEQGYNIGFFSPEMSAESIGYRFDTLFKNFSNSSLVYGEKVESKYKSYINALSRNKAKFLVTTPNDFDRMPSVSKIRNWIIENQLNMVVIDGMSYLYDERYRKGDNTTTSLTNISEDLMSLSVELKVPIIAVVQANREAAGDDKTSAPSLETIRNSDGISHNASKVISLRNKAGTLELNIVKQRNGIVGNKLLYTWDIDTGKFTYIPSSKSGIADDSATAHQNKDAFNDVSAVF